MTDPGKTGPHGDDKLDETPAPLITITDLPTATLQYGLPANLARLTGGGGSVAGFFSITDTTIPSSVGSYTTTVLFTSTDSVVYSDITITVFRGPYDGTFFLSDQTELTVTGGFATTDEFVPHDPSNVFVNMEFIPNNRLDFLSVPLGNVRITVIPSTQYTLPYLPLAEEILYGQRLSSSVLHPLRETAELMMADGILENIEGTFSFTDPSFIPSSVGNTRVSITFIPDEPLKCAPTQYEIDVTVHPAVIPIDTSTITTTAAITYGQPVSASNLTPSGDLGLPFTLANSVVISSQGTLAFQNPDAVYDAGTRSVGVVFTPSGSNFLTSTANVMVEIAQATPTITIDRTPVVISGSTLAMVPIPAHASTTGSLSWMDPNIIPNSASSYEIIFTPSSTNYTTANATTGVQILQSQDLVSPIVTNGLFTSTPGNEWVFDNVSHTWSIPPAGASTGSIVLTPHDGGAQSTVSQTIQTIPGFTYRLFYTVSDTSDIRPVIGATPATVIRRKSGVFETEFLATQASTVIAFVIGTVSTLSFVKVQAVPFVTAPTLSPLDYETPLNGSNITPVGSTVTGTYEFADPAYIPDPAANSVSVVFTPSNPYFASVLVESVLTVKDTPVSLAGVTATSIQYGQTLASSTFTGVPPGGSLVFAKPNEVLDVGLSQAVPVIFTPSPVPYTSPTYRITVTVGASSVTGIMTLENSNVTVTVDSFTWDLNSHTDVLMKDGTFGEDHTFDSEQHPFTQYGMTLSSVPNLPDIDENIPQNIFYSPQQNSYYITDGFITLPCTLALEQLTSYLENPVTTSTVRVDVGKSTPVLTQISADALNIGETLGDAMVTGVARNPWDSDLFVDGIFMFDDPLIKPGLANSGVMEYTVDFTPTISSRYHAAEGKATVTVNKLTPRLTLPGTVTLEYGTTITVANLGVSVIPTDLAGSYSFSSEGVLDAGAYVIEVRFTPESSQYNSVVASTVLTVDPAIPEVTWPILGSIYYGQSVGDSQMQGAVGAGDFSLLGPDRVPTTVGTTQATIFFDPHDEINYDSLTQVSNIRVERTTPDVSALTTTPIYYDETLNQTIISGAFNPYTGQGVPGTYLIANGQGATQPDVGDSEVLVDFTPSNLEVYTTSSAMVTVPVYSSNVVVSNVAATAIHYGQTLGNSVVTGIARNQTTEKVVTDRGVFSFVDSVTVPQVADSNLTAYPAVFTPSTLNLNTSDPVLLTLAVLPTTPVLSGLSASDIIFGSNVSTSTITGLATNPFDNVNVSGTFVFEDPTYAPDDGNAQVFSVIFTPSANVAANYVSTVTASVALNVVEDIVKQIVNLVATAGTTMIRLTWKDPNSFGLIAGYYVYVDGNLRSPLLRDPEVLLTGLMKNTEYRIGVSLVAISGKIYPLEKVIATTERSDATALALSTVPGVAFTLATPLRAYRCVFKPASKTATITLAVDSTGWARQATLVTLGGTSVMIGVSPGKDPYFVVYEFGADGSVTESAVRQTVLVQARLRWSKFYIGSVDGGGSEASNKIVILRKDKRASLALKMYSNYHHELFVGLK